MAERTRPLTCDGLRPSPPSEPRHPREGDERGAALAHLDRCAACRAEVEELAGAVDLLLSAAPEAEPPPGFEGPCSPAWPRSSPHRPRSCPPPGPAARPHARRRGPAPGGRHRDRDGPRSRLGARERAPTGSPAPR